MLSNACCFVWWEINHGGCRTGADNAMGEFASRARSCTDNFGRSGIATGPCPNFPSAGCASFMATRLSSICIWGLCMFEFRPAVAPGGGVLWLWFTPTPVHVFNVTPAPARRPNHVLSFPFECNNFSLCKLSVWMFAYVQDYWPTLHQCICGSSFYVLTLCLCLLKIFIAINHSFHGVSFIDCPICLISRWHLSMHRPLPLVVSLDQIHLPLDMIPLQLCRRLPLLDLL